MKNCKHYEWIVRLSGVRLTLTDPDGRIEEVTLQSENSVNLVASPVQRDLTVFATALYVADTLVSRMGRDQETSCHLTLPLSDGAPLLHALESSGLSQQIDLITGKRWIYSYTAALVQGSLDIDHAVPTATGVLASGGLDGYVGLHTVARAASKEVIRALHIQTNSSSLDHVKRLSRPETSALKVLTCRKVGSGTPHGISKYARTRPIVFIILGCAALLPAERICVVAAENQVGAFNFDYLAGQPRKDRSTGLRPSVTAAVARFLCSVTERLVKVDNPFLFTRKSEMLKQLTAAEVLDSYDTISCHRSNRNSPHPHCGLCSSCLLRRQSYLAAGLDDRTTYTDAYTGEDRRRRQAYFTNAHAIVRAFASDAPLRDALVKLHPTVLTAEIWRLTDDPTTIEGYVREYASNLQHHAREALALERHLTYHPAAAY